MAMQGPIADFLKLVDVENKDTTWQAATEKFFEKLGVRAPFALVGLELKDIRDHEAMPKDPLTRAFIGRALALANFQKAGLDAVAAAKKSSALPGEPVTTGFDVGPASQSCMNVVKRHDGRGVRGVGAYHGEVPEGSQD